MNKNIIILILLVIFTITVINCGSSEDSKTTIKTNNNTTTTNNNTTNSFKKDNIKKTTSENSILSPSVSDEEIIKLFANALLASEEQSDENKVPVEIRIEEIERVRQTSFKDVIEFCLNENNELSKLEECQIIIKLSQR